MAGARRVGRAYSPLLEQLHKGSDDPRSRSLAGSVLENVAQNAPWLQQLVQQPRGKLQQVSPAAMLATFAQLDAGIAAGDGPPCAPGNRRLPAALSAAGYATVMAGKWHLGFARPMDTPAGRGFDAFLGFFEGGEDYCKAQPSLGFC